MRPIRGRVLCALTAVTMASAAQVAAISPAAGQGLPAISKISVTGRGDAFLSLSWVNPFSPATSLVIVRMAVGTRAPLTRHDGAPVSRVILPKHTVKATGLTAEHQYSFAFFTDTRGKFSRRTFTTGTSPAPVTGLSAHASAKGVTVKWTNPRARAGMTLTICRAASDAGTAGCYPLPMSRHQIQTSLDTATDAGDFYQYRVRVTDAKGYRSKVVTDPAFVGTYMPSPTDVTVSTTDKHDVVVSWTNPSIDDLSEALVCLVEGDAPPPGSCFGGQTRQVAGTAGAQSQVTISNLEDSSDYTVSVISLSTHDAGSAPVNATGSTVADAVQPVHDVTVTVHPEYNEVTWEEPDSKNYGQTKICKQLGSTAPTSSTCTGVIRAGHVDVDHVFTYDDYSVGPDAVYSYALFTYDDGNLDYLSPVDVTTTERPSLDWTTPAAASGSGAPAAVSCPSATFCDMYDAAGNESYWTGSGSWSTPYSVSLSGPPVAAQSISCTSSTLCAVAAGHVVFLFNPQTISQGAQSAVNANTPADVNAVSCVTTSFCMAVDANGSAYTIDKTDSADNYVPAQDAIDPGNSLLSVSCPTDTYCRAMDNRGKEFIYLNGTWQSPVQLFADPGGSGFATSLISCSLETFCVVWAPGNVPLEFDGSNVPTALDSVGTISSLSCANTYRACQAAVGDNVLTLSQTTWTTPVPAIDGAAGGVPSVSCAIADFCVAVDADRSYLVGQ